MFRLWGKIWKDNHLLQDTVYENARDDTRTHKVFQGLDSICHTFNIGVPIWLELNIKDFQMFHKVRFTQDSFIEQIEFDYLELQVIEED